MPVPYAGGLAMAWMAAKGVLALVSVLGVGGVARDILRHHLDETREQGGGVWLAESFILSACVLVGVSLLIGVSNARVLKQFFDAYCALGLVCFAWMLVKRRLQLGRAIKAAIAVVHSIWGIMLVALVVFLCLLAIAFPQGNWDAFNFFLEQSGVMLEENTIPLHYPPSISLSEDPFDTHSLVGSVLYAFVLHRAGLPEAAEDPLSLVFLSSVLIGGAFVLVLAALVLLIIGYASSVLGNRRLGICAAALSMGMPLVVWYAGVVPLNTDLLFCLFLLALVWYANQWIRSGSHWALAMSAVALPLVVMTKPHGVVIAIVLGAIALAQGRRIGRALLAGLLLLCLGGAGVLLLFREMGASNVAAIAEGPNLAFLAGAMAVLLLYILNERRRTACLSASRVAGLPPGLWVVAGASLLLVLVFMGRQVAMTGSIFGIRFGSREGSDFLWASPIAATAWQFGAKTLPGLPEAYPRILAVGFHFLPHLFPVLLWSVSFRAFSRPSGLRINNLCLLFSYLLWVLVLGMRSPRHFLFVLPFLSVSYIDGIMLFVRARNEECSPSAIAEVVGLVAALALVIAIPLFAVALSEDPVAHAAFWDLDAYALSAGAWFGSMNMTTVLLVSSASAIVILSIRRLARWHPWWRKGLTAVLVLGVIAGVLMPTLGFVCNRGFSMWEVHRRAYEEYDGMRMAALDWLSVSVGDGAGILDFYGWGMHYLTRFRFRYGSLVYERLLAHMRPLLESDDADLQHALLEAYGIQYLVLPVSSERENAWDRVRLASGSDFLLHTFGVLFEDVSAGLPPWCRWRIAERVPSIEVVAGNLGDLDELCGALDSSPSGQGEPHLRDGDGGTVAISDSGGLSLRPAGGYAYVGLRIPSGHERGMARIRSSFSLSEDSAGLRLSAVDGDGEEMVRIEIGKDLMYLYIDRALRTAVEVEAVNTFAMTYSWSSWEGTLQLTLNDAVILDRVEPVSLDWMGLGALAGTGAEGEMEIREYAWRWEAYDVPTASGPDIEPALWGMEGVGDTGPCLPEAVK